MKRRLLGAGVFLLALTLCIPVMAADFGIGGRVSTMGVGIEAKSQINCEWGVRLGIQGLPKTKLWNSNIKGVDSDFSLEMLSVGAMLDWYPWPEEELAGLRFTGGLFYVKNRVLFDGTPDPNQRYTFGGRSYSGADLGALDGSIEFADIQPYLGLGYDMDVSSDGKWKILFDAGVFYQGRSKVELNAANPNAALVQADIDREAAQIKADADEYPIYPMVSFSVNYMW